MEKKYLVYISVGVFLGFVMGFLVGTYYKNGKAQVTKRNFFQKELVIDAYGILPKYSVNARVSLVANNALQVFVGSSRSLKNNANSPQDKIKVNIDETSKIFSKRLKTQEEIYGKDIYEKIKALEIKVKNEDPNIDNIKMQIDVLKRQAYDETSQEARKLLNQATTTDAANGQPDSSMQKVSSLNSKYIFEPLALSDIKADDQIIIYTDEESDNAKEIMAVRIEVIK